MQHVRQDPSHWSTLSHVSLVCFLVCTDAVLIVSLFLITARIGGGKKNHQRLKFFVFSFPYDAAIKVKFQQAVMLWSKYVQC